MAELLVLFTGWAFFYALHSFMAHHKVKAFVQNKIKQYHRFYRLGFNLISVILSIALFYYQFSLPAEQFANMPQVVDIIGLIVFALGLMVLFMAFKAFNKAEFIGLQQLKQTQTPEQPQHQEPQLTKTGLYAYVRHPLYFGLVLLLIGALLRVPNYPTLAFVAASFIYLPIGVYLEEKKLIAEFGDAYKQYQKEVKRFIPFIY